MSVGPTSRRAFVRGMGLLGAAATGIPALPVFAQDKDDYRALVCVILTGGLDNFDCVIPADDQGYRAWASHRVSLLEQYERAGHPTRRRDMLVALPGKSAGGHALAPELAPLAELYAQGRLAMVANVGPLVAPTTRRALEADQSLAPARLASHSDQTAIWSTLDYEGANVGWGGQLLDHLETTSPFSSMSFNGVEAFGQGRRSDQVAISSGNLGKIPGLSARSQWQMTRRNELLIEHLSSKGVKYTDMFTRDVARQQALALRQADFIRDVLRNNPASDAVRIEGNNLSYKLANVAAMVAARGAHKARRQLFVVAMNGFDNHRNEAEVLPRLQMQLADALARFDQVLASRGEADLVTTFTLSEFGRTLSANATGTDHGWGGHHFVMGGAVDGGRVVGELTPPTTDHDQAWARRGGLIPTLAIEQYGAALGAWFGVSRSDMTQVFPNLGRFDTGLVEIFKR
ncbi:MAG: DUF1501 domain-containing protein [Pseudomonadota bacterium]